jgi:hypothetical protein
VILAKKLEREPPFRIFNEDTFEVAIENHNQLLRKNKHDKKSNLWEIVDIKEFENLKAKRDSYIDPKIQFTHRRQQIGGTCLSTCLAILTTGLTGGERTFNNEQIIERIRLKINTGAPRTWSEFLQRNTNGFRLAYCNTDHRRLKSYIPELKKHDDLFLVSWYSEGQERNFQPNENGSIGGSHVVIWWKNQIIDTNKEGAMHYEEYFRKTSNNERAVKRIFRVVAPWSIHRL